MSTNTNTKKKESIGFDILLETLPKSAWRNGLFEAQTLAYRYLQKGEEREIPILMQSILKFVPDEQLYYNILEQKLNNWNNKEVQEEMRKSDSAQAASIRAVVRRKSGARSKYQKKQLVRIRNEVKKMWRNGKYNGPAEIYKAVKLIHFAFREAFIVCRRSLKEEAYSAIPDTLTISGKSIKKSDIYEYNNDRKVYYLLNEKIGGYEALHELQFQIAPYIVQIVNRRVL